MGMLDKILLLLTCIVDIYMVYDFFDNSFEVRRMFQGKRKLLVAVSAIGAIFCVNLLKNTYVNLIVGSIIFFLFAMLLFEAKAGISILYVLILDVTILCGEFVFTVLLEIPPKLMKISTIVNLADIPWQLFSAKLMAYLILIIVKQISGKGKHHMPLKTFLLYICQPVASIVIMMLSYYANLNITVTYVFKLSMIIGFAFLLLGTIVMFYAFNRYAEQSTLAREQEVTILRQNAKLEYYMQVAEMNQQHRKLVHDTTHYMKVIGELAREQQTDRIANIVQEVTGELEHIRTLIYCDNPVLNAILQEKKHEGEKQGIEMDIYVEPGIRTEKISDMDMVTMLGNLLDNAVRATAACREERYVRVRIFVNKERGFLVFKIANQYEGELVRDDEGLVSTKTEKGIHGIGLKNVESTAKKYGGYLECSVEEQSFTAVLLIRDGKD